MGKKIKTIIFIFILLLAIGVGGYFGFRKLEMAKAPDPMNTAVKLLASLCSGDYKTAGAQMESGSVSFSDEAETQEGKMLAELIRTSRRYTVTNSLITGYRTAEVDAEVSCIDPEKLAAGLDGDVNAKLKEMVEEAVFSTDIYTPELQFKSDVVYAACKSVLDERSGSIDEYSSHVPITLSLTYDGKAWHVQRNDMLRKVYSGFSADETPDELAREIFDAGSAAPVYVRKHYQIPEDAVKGPEPDRSLFGETDDPAVIEELLETPYARQLTEGQTLAWSPDTERIPGSLIRYYLDETILMIEWQEVQAKAVGTFTEIFTQDGSQMRRKLVHDRYDADPAYDANDYVISTELAAQTNAVMALSGDFYDLFTKDCGIVVYNREVCRFEPDRLDTCFVNSNGDLIMTYRKQFSGLDEVRQFVADNDIVYSLSFGPVLIDDYVNVTPEYYTLGEVNETYSRCSIGQLGPRHYLTLNINMRLNSQYVFLATLKDATAAMMKYNCRCAYALDGGQTATTVINNELINDVQFGEQRPTSDIIYFATAVPER